jgi:hypothetical protein
LDPVENMGIVDDAFKKLLRVRSPGTSLVGSSYFGLERFLGRVLVVQRRQVRVRVQRVRHESGFEDVDDAFKKLLRVRSPGTSLVGSSYRPDS